VSRFDWERMEKLVLGAWLTALIWPYANSGGFPVPLLLSLLPVAFAVAEWMPNGGLVFLADAAAVLLELVIQRPAGLTSFGALGHLFAVLVTENPTAWANMPAVVGLLLIVSATILGWLVFRQAVTRARVMLLFVLGILVLAVNHVYWNLSVEAPLAAYLLFGLWLLAETHLAESANRNPETPRTGWYLFAAALVAAPFWIGWNTPAGPSHVLHPTVTRLGGSGPGAGNGSGGKGRFGNDVNVFNIGTGIGDTNINHPVRPTNQPVMAVSGMPGPAYWQIAVYNDFNGVNWSAPAGSAYRFSVGEFAHQFFPPEVSGFPVSNWDVTFDFLLGNSTVNTIAYTGTPVQVVDASSTRSGTVYQGREQVVSPGYLYYQLIMQVPAINLTAVAGAPITAPPASLAPDLEIPTNLSPQVGTLAHQITAKATGPWQEAVDIKAYLDQHEHYTFHFQPGGTNAVNQFLLVTHAGYCDQFSSAFIMMMRTLGVPARWVVGYAPGTYQPRHHDYVISTLDAHSWAEIYVSPYGWIPVDPTPGFILPEGSPNGPPATQSHSSSPTSHPPVVPPVGRHARGHKPQPLAPVIWPTVVALMLVGAVVVLLRRIRTARWRAVRERALWRLLLQLSWLTGTRTVEGRTLRDTLWALPESLRPLALPAVRVLERSWYAGETVPDAEIEAALRDVARARRLAMREWIRTRAG
jgi:transglutaminase-like putative cysteine protease